jgi:hypothetical protein
MDMPTPHGVITRLNASWTAWRTGPPLTQDQLAASIAKAWSLAPAYTVT